MGPDPNNPNITRIATALESLEEPSITLDDATLETIRDIIKGYETAAGDTSFLKGLKDFLEMLTFMKTLLPASGTVRIGQLISWILNTLYRASDLRASWTIASNGKVNNLLQGGKTLVDAGIELDDYMGILDLQYSMDNIKTKLPVITWLFDPPNYDQHEDALRLLYDYFKLSPNQPKPKSNLELLEQLIKAIRQQETTINLNNINNCDPGPGTNGNGSGHTITMTETGVSVEGDPPQLEGGG